MRLRARGGRFFKEKAPQKPFWERFFVPQWGECEHGKPIPEGARPVFAEGKDRQRLAFLPVAHFSLGGKKAVSIKFSLFRRGGFHIRPSSNFDLSVRMLLKLW